MDGIGNVSFTGHPSAKLRIVEVTAVQGTDLISDFIEAIGKILFQPILKELSDGSI